MVAYKQHPQAEAEGKFLPCMEPLGAENGLDPVCIGVPAFLLCTEATDEGAATGAQPATIPLPAHT